MRAIIYPSVCKNQVNIPPSKSISHRAIICACLSNGKSIIRNIAFSDDIKVTIEGMRKLGAIIKQYEDYLEIEGIGEINKINDTIINCKESGSTLRFFIPIFSLTNQEISFKGEGRLMKRPQTIYKDIFIKDNLEFNQYDDEIIIKGSIKSGEYTLDGNVSSQFITGLMFALSMLKKDSIIKINPPFESKSYVNLTIQTMKAFGIDICFANENTLKIKGSQKYKACDYTVEGDYSQLAFFGVLGAINNDISCIGVNHNSLQGDKVIIDILKKSGVNIELIEKGYLIKKSNINATNIDLSDCPDLGPILTILAMYANGTTKIYNAQRLRLKESDRIDAMETELKKLSCDIKSIKDEIIITGKKDYYALSNVYAHNDHRIAMSLAVAGTCLKSSITIENAECVNKSYPNFFDDLKKLGISVELEK